MPQGTGEGVSTRSPPVVYLGPLGWKGGPSGASLPPLGGLGKAGHLVDPCLIGDEMILLVGFARYGTHERDPGNEVCASIFLWNCSLRIP